MECACMNLVSYPGSWWPGRKRAWYLLHTCRNYPLNSRVHTTLSLSPPTESLGTRSARTLILNKRLAIRHFVHNNTIKLSSTSKQDCHIPYLEVTLIQVSVTWAPNCVTFRLITFCSNQATATYFGSPEEPIGSPMHSWKRKEWLLKRQESPHQG